nr:MFS transporter [Desulfobulbaceae bacterium]
MTDEQKVVWLASCSHFITHGFMTLFPAVMVVIAAENSMSFMTIGIIAGVGYFLYGLGAFPAGYLADRYGSKRLLTVGVIGMSIASALVGLSIGTWTFALSYSLLGLFASIHHPAGLSFIARRVSERKGKALGVHGVMGNVGLFMTPLFSAFCVWYFQSWRSAYLLFCLVGLVFAVLLYVANIPGEANLSLRALFGRHRTGGGKKIDDEGEASALPEYDRPVSFLPIALLLIFAGSILSGFIFRGSLTFLPALLRGEIHFITNHDEPVVIAGYMTTAVLSFGLFGAWFGGYINDKLKHPEFFTAGVLLCVAPILYFMSRYTDTRLIVICSLFSLIYYAWQPAQNYLIAKYSKKASHGKWFGVNFFLLFGIGSIATSIGGFVADEYGVDRFYWIMALISAVASLAAFAVFFVRRHRLVYSLRMEKDSL